MAKVEITNPGRALRWAVRGAKGDTVELNDYLAYQAQQEAWGKIVKAAPKAKDK